MNWAPPRHRPPAFIYAGTSEKVEDMGVRSAKSRCMWARHVPARQSRQHRRAQDAFGTLLDAEEDGGPHQPHEGERGRVIAVGTTSCRTLESVATKLGRIDEDEDWTSIFIYPGYEFKAMDGLITNFHLPESTLIMLVTPSPL